MSLNGKTRSSFTLIELLVVLALVAILSVVVILTLNPAELIKQARDSNRLSDLATINTALNLFSADVTGGFMGTSTVVYVSIPSTTSTCSNLGLPTLPSGYTYNCVTATSTRNTDGTGWIPVNFQRISSNSPISQLPIDPINTTSTRLYYTYVAGGSWELSSSIEASKNKLGGSGDLVSKDGGSAASLYEVGNNLNLNPIEAGDSSLVGYWNFEEGPGAISSDRSGYGNHGTWYGTSTAEQRYLSGRVGSYSGYFNGVNDWLNCGTSSILRNDAFSVSVWAKYISGAYLPVITWNSSYPGLYIKYLTAPLIYLAANNFKYFNATTPTAVLDGGWHHVVFSVNGGNIGDIVNSVMYVDGQLQNSGSIVLTADQAAKTTFYIGRASSIFANSQLDEARIYNRALSASEILALYNATK